MVEAYKLSSLAANIGFDWPEVSGIFEKLEEEMAEIRAHLNGVEGLHPVGRGTAGAGAVKPPEELRSELEAEVGDLDAWRACAEMPGSAASVLKAWALLSRPWRSLTESLRSAAS